MKNENNSQTYYSIHEIVCVVVDGEYPWLDTLFNDLPKEFRSDEETFNNCESKIEIKYCKKLHKRKKRERFAFENNSITDFKFGTIIEFRSRTTSRLVCSQECNEWLMFCISYLLNINGYSFLHAACLEKDGHCLLMPSGSGAGKTMATLDFVGKKGFSLLGDDLCIIGGDNVAYSYPKKMVLYPWHLGQQSNTKNHRVSSSFKEFIKNILRRFPKLLAHFRKNNPSLKTISPYDFFGAEKMKSAAKISQLIYLERGTISDHKIVDKKTVIIKTAFSLYHELYKYFDDCLESLLREQTIIDGYDFFKTTVSLLERMSEDIPFEYLNVDETIKVAKISNFIYERLQNK